MAETATEWSGAGLYVHIPFCAHVCPYCEFAVLTGGPPRRQRFVDHLCRELAIIGATEPGTRTTGSAPPIDTIYLGGGTPSLLERPALETILAAAREFLPLAEDPWIFLEANPEDATPERLQAWRELGVRTLSLGVQAFDESSLRFLGRHHDGELARRSIEAARDTGFHTVSLDLIYGLPDDTLERWRHTLDAALALDPDHLSCYQLTIHDKTGFGRRAARGKLVELGDQPQAELFVFTHSYLRDHGRPAYEVSNFARGVEHRSRHNQKYWRRLPYLGVGPSAHSFDGSRRWWNERQLGRYEERLERGERPVAGTETLTVADHALEAAMLGLRTAAGIDVVEFQLRHGIDLGRRNAALLDRLTERGLLTAPRDILTLTISGFAIADSIVAQLDLTIGASE